MRNVLSESGYDVFVPTIKSKKTRGGGIKEKPAVPNLVFLKATKNEACDLVAERHLPLNYMIDCATHHMMVVPDKQMDDFRKVFDASLDDGGLIREPLSLGEMVRVTRGPLTGVEGRVLELLGETYVVVGLMGLLYARAQVPRAWLEKVK